MIFKKTSSNENKRKFLDESYLQKSYRGVTSASRQWVISFSFLFHLWLIRHAYLEKKKCLCTVYPNIQELHFSMHLKVGGLHCRGGCGERGVVAEPVVDETVAAGLVGPTRPCWWGGGGWRWWEGNCPAAFCSWRHPLLSLKRGCSDWGRDRKGK